MAIAWNLGIRKLEIQLDSTAAINILLQNWETKIVHVYREANHLADCLAARGHDIDTGATLRLEDDPVIRRWENYDARGVTERRTITGMC
ncbi:hypothetical protein LINPERHAP1_LOCUS14583 [Linum perenne]